MFVPIWLLWLNASCVIVSFLLAIYFMSKETKAQCDMITLSAKLRESLDLNAQTLGLSENWHRTAEGLLEEKQRMIDASHGERTYIQELEKLLAEARKNDTPRCKVCNQFVKIGEPCKRCKTLAIHD